MLGLNTAESEMLRENSDPLLHRGSMIKSTVKRSCFPLMENSVPFMTLGPATLKDNICIGEEERTKDISLSFRMKSYFLLSPNTVSQACLPMAFNKPLSYFTHLKGIPDSHFSVAYIIFELIWFLQAHDRLPWAQKASSSKVLKKQTGFSEGNTVLEVLQF